MELRDKNGLTEEEFLKQYNADKYPKPSVTADIAVIAHEGDTRYILLIQRGGHPYLGCWALPGGFSNKNERIEHVANRELEEETGVKGLDLKLVGVYSKPGRDPRGWTMSCAYKADVNKGDVKAQAGDDAANAKWFKVNEKDYSLTCENTTLHLEDLAFDHNEIVSDALNMK